MKYWHEPTFDIYTTKNRPDGSSYVTFMFVDLTLTVAEILSGADDFDDAIIGKGWCGTSPAWVGFKPLVVMPHGELIKNDQFKFLMELAG